MQRIFARDSRRYRVVFVGLATAAVVLTTSLATGQQPARAGSYGFSWPERCLMRKINHARHRHGLARLRADKQIGYVARRHARTMARLHYIWDEASLGYKVTRWRSLGQNSGYAKRCRRVFKRFMHSPVHRRNILGRYHFMGVGTKKRNGKLYTSQVFEGRRNPGNVWHYP